MKMTTTVENLLVQIFERKNGIIEQVKQRTEFYNQHLASKLLIDGITPPPWFWNPAQFSDQTELNKEELISELLLPHPQPTVGFSMDRFSQYKNLVTENHGEISDGLFMEKGFKAQDAPMVATVSNENHAQCAPNGLPELDGISTSPVDETDDRFSNICYAPDQSLARFQRSKSRQQALEYRSSAKAQAKSRLNHENGSDVPPSCIILSISASKKNDEASKLAEPCDISGKSCGDWDLDQVNCQSKEKGMNIDTGRTTRSRSSNEVPTFVSDSTADAEAGSSCDDAKARKTRSRSIYVSMQDDCVNEFSMAEPFASSCQRCGEMKLDERDCQSKETHINSNTTLHARCRNSGKPQSYANDSLITNFSSGDTDRMDHTIVDPMVKLRVDYVNGSIAAFSSSNGPTENFRARESMLEDGRRHKENGADLSCSRITRFSRSVQQNPGIGADLDLPFRSAKADRRMLAPTVGSSMEHSNVSNEVLGLVKTSVGLVGRVTMSQTRSGDKGITEHVNRSNSSSQGDKDDQNASGGQMLQPCGEIHDVVTLKGNAEILVANDLVSRDLVGEQSVNSSLSDAKRRREFEYHVAWAPSDCFMVVKPKQLDFDDMEEHNSNETSTSISRKIILDSSPVNICCSLSEHELSQDKDFSCNINQLSSHKKSLETLEVSNKGKEDWRGSFDSDVNRQFEIQMEKDRSVMSEHPMSISFENDVGAVVQIENSQMLQKADIFLSNAVPDIEIHQVELHLNEGHDASPDMLIENGAYNYEGKDEGASAYHVSNNQNVRPSYLSNSTNLASGQSKDCSIEKVGKADSIFTVIDEKKQLPLRETQIFSCLDGEVSSKHAYNLSCDRRDLDGSLPQGENDGTADSTCIALDERRRLPLRETQIFSCLDGEVSTKHEHNLSCDKRDLDRSPLQGENGLACNSFGSLHREDEIINISSARAPQIMKRHSPPERRFRPAKELSWPQIKRRKIEDQQTNSFTTSPSFRVQKPYCILPDLTTSCLNNAETKGDAVFVDAFKEDRNLMEVIELAPESHITTGTFYFEEENKHKQSSFAIDHKQLGASLVLSSTEDDARGTRGCLAKEVRTPSPSSNFLDITKPHDEQSRQHLLPLDSNFDLPNSANLACFENTLPEGNSHQGEDRLLSQCSVPSPNDKDLDFVDVDQTMPVLEGFIVHAQEDNGEVNSAGDGIDFDKLNLSRTTIERASILARICKSASADTCLSHFSSCFEFQGTHDLFQSEPNGLLERLGTLPLDINVDEQFGFDDSVVNASKGMPYSDCLPYSGAQFGWHPGNHYASPAGKLWERLSSYSGNSEKSSSSNPELTCFPIEEDFSVSEENKTLDEEADEVQEEIDSSDNAQREPLKDFSNSSLNPHALVSADEMSLSRDGLDYFNTKTSFTGIQNEVKQKSESLVRNNSEAKENQMLAMGANKIRKAKESFKNSFNKRNLPCRTSMRQEQKLSLKESKRNNIVSNVSSFIPLVQQKQAAAVCAGKRDIKVKALEAAEAAKRLEEKKENERKVRKEALKLERAKMEKENMRQKELDKKKREEERKRKDADMQAKKRLREEEERKQKEKKRMRIEVRQRQQREQEEKTCAEKAEKEKQHFKVHEQVNSNKESNNESRRLQNRDNAGDDVAFKETETKSVPFGLAMDSVQQTTIHFEECGASCEIGKATDEGNNSSKNDDMFVQKCLEKSYDISPYQCSDDEDEEEDLPSGKLIPSWASKSSVALVLPLQQEMDPDVIFPQGSFCSMDEVLLPRKLQQN